MSNPRYAGYSRAGASYKHAASLTNAYAVFPVTIDAVSAPRADVTQPFINVNSVVANLTSIAGGATSVTFYLAHDSLGDFALSPTYTVNIQPGLTTAATGSAAQPVGIDYSYLARANENLGTIYIVAKLNAGTATGAIWVNWKA